MKTITHNGIPCVEARVHMLATDSLGAIMSDVGPYDTDMVLISELPENLRGHERPHNHLYITTDEEIKKGDWYLYNGKPYKCPHSMMGTENPKIISSTDPKLLKPQIKQVNWIGSERIMSLPQIPQSFIEEYCKAGGIDKVLVEYELNVITSLELIRGDKMRAEESDFQPKTDSNNCIIIHPVEENIYNVNRQVFLKLVHDVGDSLSQKDSIGFNLDKWIKENL